MEAPATIKMVGTHDSRKGIRVAVAPWLVTAGFYFLDTTIAAMALTSTEMNSKYKETSEGGLAVSLVLC